MDIIEIFFYLGSFAIGAIGVWFLNYKKLIKGFNIKEKNAENLILNAKQKANKLLKDTEKKEYEHKKLQTGERASAYYKRLDPISADSMPDAAYPQIDDLKNKARKKAK